MTVKKQTTIPKTPSALLRKGSSMDAMETLPLDIDLEGDVLDFDVDTG